MVYELCTFSFSFFSLLISFFFPSVLFFFQGGQLFSKDGASSNGSTSLCVCADGHYYFWCFFFSLRFWQLTVPWSCLIFFFISSHILVFAVFRIDLAACSFSTLSTVLDSFTLCSSFFSLHLFLFFLIYLCSHLFACSFFFFFWNTGSNPFAHSAR